ncbi:hypothetical protein LFL96_36965 (plasmid) [Paraburkholderia sp. D15]|uniref:hypothetical protein n=1 Tax=Paraburkholderia sp. D15 TaxID=2880218 RepID=UPI00247A3D4B|nr:hypothetical protein [Paraburkholderia sp. D15]WGS55071.1 hypothetical protein LFL96_36965 [Paraburkholderia sp. D15]
MHGKHFFLNRVVARSREWQCRYPALSAAYQNPESLSGGRQLVAAVADPEGIRCVFFSNLGSVLDFAASWAELDSARTWWHFTVRWNFWYFDDARSLFAMRAAGHDPDHRTIATGPQVDRRYNDSLTAFLDRAEARFRRDIGNIAILQPVSRACTDDASATS